MPCVHNQAPNDFNYMTIGSLTHLTVVEPPAKTHIISEGFHNIILREYDSPFGIERILIGQKGACLYPLRYDETAKFYVTSEREFQSIKYDVDLQLMVGTLGSQEMILDFSGPDISTIVSANGPYRREGDQLVISNGSREERVPLENFPRTELTFLREYTIPQRSF